MTDKYKVTHINRDISPRDMADVLEVIESSLALADCTGATYLSAKFVALAESYTRHLFDHMMTIEKLGVDNET